MPQLSVQNKKEKTKEYLRRRSDFLATYKGNFIRKELLVLYAKKNGLGVHRLGITAPKTVGPAVVRNRFKRWCREFYRKSDLAGIKDSLDFNVQIGNKKLKKEDFKNAKHADFEKQIREALLSLIKHF